MGYHLRAGTQITEFHDVDRGFRRRGWDQNAPFSGPRRCVRGWRRREVTSPTMAFSPPEPGEIKLPSHHAETIPEFPVP
jgi:hypothetical protein